MKNLLTVVGLLLICNSLQATIYTFDAASGDWDDSSNWDVYPGGIIGVGDEVIIDGICTIPSSLQVNNSGTLTVNIGAELITTTGGPILLNTSDGTMVIDGKLTTNNNAYNQGLVTINGELEVNHNYINFDTFINNGKVISQGSQYSNTGIFTNNDEFISLTTMSSQDQFNQLGTYRGTDTYSLDPFTNEGTFAPGVSDNSIGKYTFNTSYTEDGTYEVDIAGDAGAGIAGGHDQLVINLNLNISGDLKVQLQGAYIPAIGASFTILTSANPISGTYTTIDYPTLPADREWEIEYNSTSIKLNVIEGIPPTIDTYYVSQSTGNDINDGLSPSTAWQSIGKIASILYESGDSVLLKRGDTWTGVSQYFSRSFVVIGAYDEGNIPMISNIQELPNTTTSSNWSLINGLWECELPLATTRLFLDDVEVLRASLLSEVGVMDSEGFIPKWYHLGSTIYIDNPTNPATVWTSIKGSQNYITFNMEGSSLVTVDGIAIEGATGPSLQLANSQNVTIKNCELGKHGSSGLLLVNGSNNCKINNNTIDSYYTQMYGIGNSTDRGCRDGVRLANDASNNTIENNTIKNWSHNGIELLNTFINSNGVNNNKILYNHISAPDIPYAHPIGTDGPSGRCEGNDIGYNYITDCRTTCQINGENNWFHHNILKHFRQSPAKNSFSAHAITIAAYDVLGIGNISRNNIFENNLIVDSDESAFRFDDQGFDILVDSIFIRNNIIYDSGLDPINGDYNTGTAIYFDDTDYINNIFFENNLFYQSTEIGDVLYKVISDEYIDVTDLNLLNEIDGIIANNNLKDNPQLDTDDTPLNNSPAVNNGRNNNILNEAVDYYSNPRVIGGKIDIGPIENQNSCNSRTVIFIDSLAIGSADGASWRNAFTTIHGALSACPLADEKEYWVSKGHYYPTDGSDQTISLTLEDNSSLFGGFIGEEFNRSERNYLTNKTILSGDIGVVDVVTDNTDEIISQPTQSNVLYDGIYIEDAHSTLDRSSINIGISSTDIFNSTIQNNESNQYAAVTCLGCTSKLENVEIKDNINSTQGMMNISSTGNITITNSNIEGQIDVIGILEIIGNTIFK